MGTFHRLRSVVLTEAYLSDEAYRSRHRILQVILWLQLPLLAVVARMTTTSPGSLGEMAGMPTMGQAGMSGVRWMIAGLLTCALGSLVVRSRRGGAVLVSLGLILSAAATVSIGGGLTDLHFGFFVVVGLISLYQDWLTLLLAVVLIMAHHTVMGLFAPAALYSDPHAREQALRFAALHAGFVLAVCAVQLVYWRFAHVAQLAKEVAQASKEEEFRRLAERFEALVQDSRDVIIVMDRQGTIHSTNAAIERVMGYRSGELDGVRYRTLVHPDDLPQLTAAADQGRTEYRGERRTRHADGTWHWHDVTLRDLTANPAVRGVVASHRDVTERHRLQELLVYDASHDGLTGLANRAELLRVLERSLTTTHDELPGVAVLYLDLNGFKQINDTYGHETGDALLIVVATALRRCVLGADTAGRLGGDEFAVVLHQISEPREAVAVAERILGEVGQPVSVNGSIVSPRVSIGIAVADRAGLQTDQLLHRADTAMYHAKRDRTTDWQLYLAGMHEPGGAATMLEDDLRHAVERGQLQLQYLPIVALADGEIIGFEALVRWDHPTRGLLQPAEFIALASQSDLIHQVGHWVLRQACTQVGRWQDRYPSGPRLALHVNFGARQLKHGSVVADLFAILDETGFAPRDLVLEVVEATLVNADVSTRHLDSLRDRGIRIALDDFGAGNSSLRHLTGLPVDILKLDGCFVAELDGTSKGGAVAEAAIRLGQALHWETMAECVETQEQAAELTLLGCHAAQGLRYCAPLEPERMDDLLAGGVHLPQAIASADGRSAV
ncbi:MAG: EAL domain-containing protein [Actinoplanes sp.]